MSCVSSQAISFACTDITGTDPLLQNAFHFNSDHSQSKQCMIQVQNSRQHFICPLI